jgi:trehalose synthase
MDEVALRARPAVTLAPIIGGDASRRLGHALDAIRAQLDGHTLWHVNSAARGGGVAEMLAGLLPYQRAAGTPVRWLVIDGDPAFFTVTKRIHHNLHEAPGDGGGLGEAERAIYDRGLAAARKELRELIAPGDVVVLHDPQTAGLARPLRSLGATVVWRCHIGADTPGALVRRAWDFLWGDVTAAQVAVFSRPAHVWEGLPPEQVAVVAPCIDVASAKNQPLTDGARDAILAVSGLLPRPGEDLGSAARYVADGSERVVEGRAALLEESRLRPDVRLVVQVSRWDRLKDPVGVLAGFARHGPLDDVHLVLAGPVIGEVVDDPESAEVYAEVRAAWDALAPPVRRRVHLACLPMDDPDENAAMVNALQRRADVVVQKSVAEGFGLTVAEAMWKRRPVVASRVGGVQDQIVDGENGFLIDAADLEAFGRLLLRLVGEPDLAHGIGDAAHRQVCDHYLPVHHFEAEADLLARVTV